MKRCFLGKRPLLRALALGAASQASTACTHEDGVDTPVIQLAAVRSNDGTRAPDLPANTCVRAPVLLGARRNVVFPIELPLRIVLGVERDAVDIHFENGSDDPSFEALPLEELEAGFDVAVRSRSGTEFSVSVFTGCELPD